MASWLSVPSLLKLLIMEKWIFFFFSVECRRIRGRGIKISYTSCEKNKCSSVSQYCSSRKCVKWEWEYIWSEYSLSFNFSFIFWLSDFFQKKKIWMLSSELARDALNSNGYCVIGGYLSPVNDSYKKKVCCQGEKKVIHLLYSSLRDCKTC